MSVTTVNDLFLLDKNEKLVGTVLELKYNHLSQDAPKEHRYQWYLIILNKRLDLTFLEMKNNIRHMAINRVGGTVELDLTNKEIKINSKYLLVDNFKLINSSDYNP